MPQWENVYANRETTVGGGYWAKRTNVSSSGKVYSKLVKADRSPKASMETLLNLK